MRQAGRGWKPAHELFVPTSTSSRGCHKASSGGRGLQSENYSNRLDSGNHLALGIQGACRVPQEVCLDGLQTGKGEEVSRSLMGSSVVMSQPGIQLMDLSLFNKQMLSRAYCVPGTVLGAWDTPVSRQAPISNLLGLPS